MPDLQIPRFSDIDPGKACAGLVYRYRTVGWFRVKRGFYARQALTFLASPSCEGCSRCWPMQSHLAKFPERIQIHPGVKGGDRVLATWGEDSQIVFLPFNAPSHK